MLGCGYHVVLGRDPVMGLRTFLLEQTAKGGDRQVLQYVTDLLNKNVGFLINERFINIPAQVGSFPSNTVKERYEENNIHNLFILFQLPPWFL